MQGAKSRLPIPDPNKTLCGAAPGPSCIGCHGYGECGTTDIFAEASPRNDWGNGEE